MYDMDYEKAQMAFLKKTRIDDVNSGSFEVVGKVDLQNLSMFLKRIRETQDKVEKYIFYDSGVNSEPLQIADVLREAMEISHRKCELVTVAPVNEWNQNQSLIESFDRIVVRRQHVDDTQNDAMCCEKTLTKEMYQVMPDDLKERISFCVNCDEEILGMETMKNFIDFAITTGINEIEFVSKDQRKQFNQELLQEQKRIQACIQTLRGGGKLKKDMIDPKPIKENVSLFRAMRDELIRLGWHFEIIKALSNKEGFFAKITLTNGKAKVIFTQKVYKNDLKVQIWRYSRSHKYILEI